MRTHNVDSTVTKFRVNVATDSLEMDTTAPVRSSLRRPTGSVPLWADGGRSLILWGSFVCECVCVCRHTSARTHTWVEPPEDEMYDKKNSATTMLRRTFAKNVTLIVDNKSLSDFNLASTTLDLSPRIML